MELLVVDSEVRPEAVLVRATGEIDSSTAGQLRSQLQSALQQAGSQESRLLILDLRGVTYFGSAGLNAVLDCHKQGLQAGTAVRLVADWALAHLPLERIVGRTDPDNVASRTVMQRLGFELVGPVGDQVAYEYRSPDDRLPE